MSQPSLKEKFEEEQLLSTALAIEVEDVKKTLAQLKLDKSKPLYKGPFSLNVEYYLKKIFKELDKIESRLEKLETGELPRDWNFTKSFGNSKTSHSSSIMLNFLKKRKTNKILTQI